MKRRRLSDTYHARAAQIRAARTGEDLRRLERSTDGFYDLGLLTIEEYRRLDGMIVGRLVRLEPDGPQPKEGNR